jgi:hypothetical protein
MYVMNIIYIYYVETQLVFRLQLVGWEKHVLCIYGVYIYSIYIG